MSIQESPHSKAFYHRPNKDDTIDSICSYCFETVASARTVAELFLAEVKHTCRKLREVRDRITL
jgi:hypothetical protein